MTDKNACSISELQQKANAGDAQAQFDLAYCYAKGTDVERNEDQALIWLKKAAEQGLVGAQLSLGFRYFLDVEQEETRKLINKYIKSIVTNTIEVPLHPLHLALILSHSPFVLLKDERVKAGDEPVDVGMAFGWFKKAAEQNCIEAQYYLAYCYTNGIGIEQNNEIAFKWYKKAAEEGFVEAQYQLARCYHDGRGIEHNDDSAFEWFYKAAEQNFAEAQYWLARCYFDGIGVDKNADLALEWLKKAAKGRSQEARILLGDLYAQGKGVEQNNELAYEGYEDVFLDYIGENLPLPDGKVPTNSALARKGIEELANRGYQKAKNLLAEHYHELSERDFKDGAFKENNKLACDRLIKMLELGKEELIYKLLHGHGYGYGRGDDDLDPKVHNAIERRYRTLIYFNKLDAAYKLIQCIYYTPKEEFFLNLNWKTIREQSIELSKKNQELEEKNKKLQEAQKELEDMMSMFAHKFRSPLDAIIYNTEHENQVKLSAKAAQTMRGLLDIFSIISTDAAVLKNKIKQDRRGGGRISAVFDKTLDMILLHLLSVSGTEKIQQHYFAYAKAHGQCDASVSYDEWRDEYFELEQQLQAEWERSYAQLLTQSASLQQRLVWLKQHFFKLELIGFERSDIQFKEYGVTESFLTILLNEILVNAFKYYASASQQPVVLEWTERDGYQILLCRNPSIRSERTIIKGSRKGHAFLSALAHKTGSIFIKPTPQDNFVVEFGIPNEYLIAN